MTESWRHKTRTQYATYTKQWKQYCRQEDLDPLECSDTTLINFLTRLCKKQRSYSTISSAKAAVLSLWEAHYQERFQSRLLSRFMKGAEQISPPPVRLPGVWDPTMVLDYLESLGDNCDLSLRVLTHKCVTLIAMASAQRVQTIWLLDLLWLSGTEEALCFVVPQRLKQTIASRATPDVFLPRTEKVRTCVWSCVFEYISRTHLLRTTTKLFVITKPPYTQATRPTISGWIRGVLEKAGVDPKIFRTHSTRAAATSKARKFLPLPKVRAAADWSSQRTFIKHYKRKVLDRGEFTRAVWKK